MNLLLAQAAPDAAEGWVGLIERILAGGLPLICLVIAAICGYAFYKQLTKNNALEVGFREKVEALLREMLDKDRESMEAVGAAVQAVEAFQASLSELKRSKEVVAAKVDGLLRKVERLEDVIRGQRGGGN